MRTRLALAAALAVLLGAPASALAHAQLTGTIPQAGATVQTQPPLVVFEYNQAVGFTPGAVRVYDAQGNEVDDGEVQHPAGVQSRLGVGLKAGLQPGTYTATYRVISADTHIVYGGLVFNFVHASPSSLSVASLLTRDRTGATTIDAFDVARALNYLALSLFAGAVAFLLLVWRGGTTSEGFRRRIVRLLAAAVALGLLSTVLGFLLQGADAAGLSLWSSVKGPVIRSVLHSRFGWVWGVEVLVWLALALLLAIPRVRRGDPPPRPALAAAVAAAVYLVLTPVLSGHASVQHPVWLLFPADVLHVGGAAIWIGGLCCLLFAVPAATREQQPPQRTALLVDTLGRFSPLALACVVAIAASGVVQAIVFVRTVAHLFDTQYGNAILVKIGLLLVLIAIAAVNRQRIIPALERLLSANEGPGGAGLRLRTNLRAEVLLTVAVLGVSAVLLSYTPPIDQNTGPFSTTTTLGPAELEMTVDPARVGLNTIHLYLIDAKTGAQFTETKKLTVTASLPSKGIGPLPLVANLSGPGHYTLNAAELTPGGTWKIQLIDQVSLFDEYIQTVSVPIA